MVLALQKMEGTKAIQELDTSQELQASMPSTFLNTEVEVELEAAAAESEEESAEE
jgi:hypothetical protein